MDCKNALPAILVVIAFAMSSVTGREPTHGCNKACPAHAPASAPAPTAGMESGAAHQVEQPLRHAQEANSNPDAWDSKHDFCTAASMTAADLDAGENYILQHLEGSVFHHRLKLGANETKVYVQNTAKFYIRNLEAKASDVLRKKVKDASDEIKNSCCSDSNSKSVCLGGWFTIGTDSVFIRIAPTT